MCPGSHVPEMAARLSAVITRGLRAGWLPSRLFVALLTAVWSTPVIPGEDVPAPNTLLFIQSRVPAVSASILHSGRRAGLGCTYRPLGSAARPPESASTGTGSGP